MRIRQGDRSAPLPLPRTIVLRFSKRNDRIRPLHFPIAFSPFAFISPPKDL